MEKRWRKGSGRRCEGEGVRKAGGVGGGNLGRFMRRARHRACWRADNCEWRSSDETDEDATVVSIVVWQEVRGLDEDEVAMLFVQHCTIASSSSQRCLHNTEDRKSVV